MFIDRRGSDRLCGRLPRRAGGPRRSCRCRRDARYGRSQGKPNGWRAAVLAALASSLGRFFATLGDVAATATMGRAGCGRLFSLCPELFSVIAKRISTAERPCHRVSNPTNSRYQRCCYTTPRDASSCASVRNAMAPSDHAWLICPFRHLFWRLLHHRSQPRMAAANVGAEAHSSRVAYAQQPTMPPVPQWQTRSLLLGSCRES